MSTDIEKEVRREFEDWFAASEAKDLDAMMAKIADEAVSYEHVDRLQHVGVGAIREVCKAGLDAVVGKFRWDVPDLEVIVRGDIAVSWGMNRMTMTPPGGERTVMWSRGTRVFQKVDGTWKMIHQHVSFPVDPATGKARMDLAP